MFSGDFSLRYPFSIWSVFNGTFFVRYIPGNRTGSFSRMDDCSFRAIDYFSILYCRNIYCDSSITAEYKANLELQSTSKCKYRGKYTCKKI